MIPPTSPKERHGQTHLGALGSGDGAGATKHHNVQQRVGAQTVGAVHGRARGLTRGVQAGNNGVRVGRGGHEHAAVVVLRSSEKKTGKATTIARYRRNSTHVVVNSGQHGDRVLGNIYAGKDLRSFTDARQTLGQLGMRR